MTFVSVSTRVLKGHTSSRDDGDDGGRLISLRALTPVRELFVRGYYIYMYIYIYILKIPLEIEGVAQAF